MWRLVARLIVSRRPFEADRDVTFRVCRGRPVGMCSFSSSASRRVGSRQPRPAGQIRPNASLSLVLDAKWGDSPLYLSHLSLNSTEEL
jgi:hypothetical protein